MRTVGEVLPHLDLPQTRTSIVAAAIASRDYQDVHHDPDLAVARGSQDIFMNILTSNALAERYVVAWAGAAARVRRIRIRIGVPIHPGDVLRLSGEVTAVEGDRVEVAVRGDNASGTHLSGTVTVEVPA